MKMRLVVLVFLSITGLVTGSIQAGAQRSHLSFQRPFAADGEADRQSSIAHDRGGKDELPGHEYGVPRLGVRVSAAPKASTEWCSGKRAASACRSRRRSFRSRRGWASRGIRLVRKAGGVEGYEARFITQTAKYDRQILMLWGPQSDLARDPRWGRSEEVYGEDPFFNGTMAVAFIKGLQGDDPKYWQAAALLKHFLANSNEDHRNEFVVRFR